MEATFINDEVSRDLDEAIEFAVAAGLSGIELRIVGDTNIVDLEWQEIESIGERLQASGLSVAAISTSLFKCPLPQNENARGQGTGNKDPFRASSTDFQDHLSRIPKAAEVAARLGCAVIRCFAFLGKGELAPVRSRIVESLRQAGAVLIAQGLPVRFCLENEPSTYVRTAADVGALVRELGDPFDVLWDPGNAYFSGDRAPLLDFPKIAGQVAHIHLKDPKADGEGLRFVPLGEGEIDYPEQVTAWASSGFDGYVSLEPHLIIGRSSVDGARRCLEYLRPLLQGAGVPGGSAADRRGAAR